MPTATPDLILADAQTGTGAGVAVGFGERMRYANSTAVKNSNGFPQKFKVRVILKDSTTGGSATVAVQESDDNSTYTTLKSFSLAIASTDPNQKMLNGLFSTTKRYVRTNVTAIAGGAAPAVNAYMTLGTFGI